MNPIAIGVLAAGLGGLGIATWKAPRLVGVLLWSLVVTIFISAVLFVHLPMSLAEKGSWITVMVPLLWVGFQFWAYWQSRKWIVILVFLGLIFSCALILAFGGRLG